MQRVFVTAEQIEGNMIRVTGEDAHHLHNVLRMRAGERVTAGDGGEWEYCCEIVEITGEEVLLRITDAQKPGRELPSRVTLLQCLPKGDKMETVIQKAVELGAAKIVPVAGSRCVVKLDEKKAKAKTARWNAIAKAAAEQSKRMIIPTVGEVLPFAEAVRSAAADSSREKPCLLMPYANETGMDGTRKILQSIRPGTPVTVLIGPEGGFSDEEVETARAAGFQTVTLGKRILRTETAGMAMLAILAYLLEEA